MLFQQHWSRAEVELISKFFKSKKQLINTINRRESPKVLHQDLVSTFSLMSRLLIHQEDSY